MRILAIGDIIGRPGRSTVCRILPGLRRTLDADLVTANGENVAGGIGLTPATADELLAAGVDVVTSGNHIWAHREIIPYLDSEVPVLRPLNYPAGVPGRGSLVTSVAGGTSNAGKSVLVVSLIGRTFMDAYDSPFQAMDRLLERPEKLPPVVIVDFHAEATSEKVAMGRYLDGRVSAVLGTHTHVGTIDARVLPNGTAYVTDIGMAGPTDSVIGDSTENVLERFLTILPHRFAIGKGQVVVNAVLVEVDDATGRALSIERITREDG